MCDGASEQQCMHSSGSSSTGFLQQHAASASCVCRAGTLVTPAKWLFAVSLCISDISMSGVTCHLSQAHERLGQAASMTTAAVDLTLCKCANGGAGQHRSISLRGLAVRGHQGSGLHATPLSFRSPSTLCGNQQQCRLIISQCM